MDRQNRPDLPSIDDRTQSIDVVIRGYDRPQVHKLLHRLNHELRAAQADKDAAAAHAAELASHLAGIQAETESLRGKAREAGEPSFESMGTRISNMLKLAEEEATDIRRVALDEQTRSRTELESMAEESAWTRTEAQNEAGRVVEEAQEEARRALKRAHDGAARIVADAQKHADEVTAHVRTSVEQAEAQSKARMAKVEEDFDLTLKSRRAEAARIEQERDQSSRHDAKTRIEHAQRKSEDMVAAAEQRVADLDAQRAEIHTWLTQIREVLTTVSAVDATAATTSVRGAATSTPSARQGPAAASGLATQGLPAESAGAGTTLNRDGDQAPDASSSAAAAARPAEPSGSEGRRSLSPDDPLPESNGARPDHTVLAHEDVLAYRQRRRKGR